LGGFIALKELKMRSLELGDLEGAQVISEPFPGELTLPFGYPGQKQCQDTDFDMRLNP